MHEVLPQIKNIYITEKKELGNQTFSLVRRRSITVKEISDNMTLNSSKETFQISCRFSDSSGVVQIFDHQ